MAWTLPRLLRRLDALLPRADAALRELLARIISAPYIDRDGEHGRVGVPAADRCTGATRGKPVGYSVWFVIIVAVFTSCLIVSNIIAVKLIEAPVFGVFVPAALVVFPLSYIFGDILTEVYGFAKARTVIWLAFACNLLAVVFFVSWSLVGLFPLFMGTIPSESASAVHMTTAMALVMGLGEVLGGVLLLFRRTTTVGALVLVPLVALTVPLVAILARHQQRMAELIHGSHNMQAQWQPEVEALKREVSDLRALVQHQTLMLDTLGRPRATTSTPPTVQDRLQQ